MLSGTAKMTNARCSLFLKNLNEDINLRKLCGIMLGPQSGTFKYLTKIG